MKKLKSLLLFAFLEIHLGVLCAAAPPDFNPNCILFGLHPGHDKAALNLPADCIPEADIEFTPPIAKTKKANVQTPLFYRLEVPKNQESNKIFEQLRRNPSIAYVEYDGVGQGGGFTPNDPGYSNQWHHSIIGCPEAWEVTQGTQDVTLAVLDTGLNLTLPDYSGRLVAGYDFVNDDNNPTDDNGHGSAVTAVAAGTGNNGTDTAGVDWNCRIMPIKVLDSNNFGFYSNWAAGIRWAADNGADVINLSAGGSSSSITLENAIDYAISRNVIFITITHNDSSSIRFPGSLPQVISVGATQNDNTLSPFSNFGPQIDIVAPGGIGNTGGSFSTNITATNINGSTTWWWGTSFAAPQVAGAACLLRSIDPAVTHQEVEIILSAAADDLLGDLRDTQGFDNYFGYGRLNIPAAITLLQSSIDILEVNGNLVQLQLPAPSNASLKQPYGFEFSDTLENNWTRISAPSNINYTSTTAIWTDDGSETTSPLPSRRFYRRFIRR